MKDAKKREEYDESLFSLPARFRPVYGESRLARVDVWVVILGFLLVLTAIQYVSQQFKFNSFVKYWKSQDDVQQWGLEATKDEYQEKLKSAKKLSKQEKTLIASRTSR